MSDISRRDSLRYLLGGAAALSVGSTALITHMRVNLTHP